jgi:hypothetical protein
MLEFDRFSHLDICASLGALTGNSEPAQNTTRLLSPIPIFMALAPAPQALRASIGLRSFRILTFASFREVLWVFHSRPLLCFLQLARHSFSDGWPLCGYYVLLADLNMPPSVICHLSSVIRFAIGYSRRA